MSDVYLDTEPPPAEQRITELHAWIATHSNGSEGIMAGELLLPGVGRRMVTLVTSRRGAAERLRPVAEHIQRIAVEQGGEPVSIRLVTYIRKDSDA